MRKSSKIIIAIGTSGVVVASAGAAYAYWTTTGSGVGSATTRTPAATQLSVSAFSAPTGMAPGIAAAPITVTVKNNDTSNNKAQQVIVTISSVTGGAGSCSAADYTLSGGTMTTGAADLAPNGTTTFSGATLGFFNDPANAQDGCKGATVNLAFALS